MPATPSRPVWSIWPTVRASLTTQKTKGKARSPSRKVAPSYVLRTKQAKHDVGAADDAQPQPDLQPPFMEVLDQRLRLLGQERVQELLDDLALLESVDEVQRGDGADPGAE